MRILGVSCYFHDAAAALIEDGRLVAAAEEERFSRAKHDFSFPEKAIRFCLEEGGISGRDLDYVAFFEKPLVKFERLLLSSLYFAPRSHGVFREAMTAWLADKLWVKERIQKFLGAPGERILFLEHHLSHAAAAFLSSPFEEAAILTVDGVGEWSTATLGRGRASFGQGPNRIEILSEMAYPHSLGLLYSAFTAYLGFEVNEGEYKVMGMAPFGRPRYVEEIHKMLRIHDDGSFFLDLDYFSFPHDRKTSFSRRFEELLGPARPHGARFVTARTSLYDDPRPAAAEELETNERHADIAASIQKVTEEILLKMARELYRRTQIPRLCIGGGVGYNCVANYRISKETPFKEIYIHPASGDSGAALGAALYAHHVLLGRPRKFVMDNAFWGQDYPPGAMRTALESQNLSYQEMPPDRMAQRAAELLARGKILGLFQGRFEWGPRALGHRSILANPTLASMKDRVNIAVKFREPFRPFAPSVLAETAPELFELDGCAPGHPLRFMLMTVPVRESKRDRIPATTHVDGTARIQIVDAATDPFYHDLIRAFGEATGVPAVLNTSFNLKGEPIVASPADALRTFLKSGMDALILGPFLVSK